MPEPYPFAKRTSWPSATNRLTVLIQQFKSQKIEVLDLTESNPTHCGFLYPQEKILTSLVEGKNLEYNPHPQGLRQPREAISQYYQQRKRHVSPDQIFLTASTSEAYAFLFRLLADPQDHILFPTPSYPLFDFLSDLNDTVKDDYPLDYNGRWTMDARQIESLITKRTKAIVTVNPNNPTGSFVSPEEIKALNHLCRSHHLAMISDEVFGDYVFPSCHQPTSFVDNQDVLTFTLGGLSKSLGLPQMKLAWIVVSGPDSLVALAKERLEFIADTYLSVNTLVQQAAADWLRLFPEIQSMIMDRIKNNLSFLQQICRNSQQVQVLPVEGGWYAVLEIPKHKTEEEWILEFLKEDHVLVHPGYFFNFPREGYGIISLLPKEEVFQKALRRILSRTAV
ncbi:MAG: pyridoxal phosphate-dependent aminotransferase [Candidatus Omnitrophota bacterium]|nr:pyridoxal phosphate-dependent aminotransferase [Candidatus Omnitrophota bacterium]